MSKIAPEIRRVHRESLLANNLGNRHETSPPHILASGSGRCRAAGRVADRKGANLRPDRLMVGYAADTDRYTCMER
jgi:hypothetical protein